MYELTNSTGCKTNLDKIADFESLLVLGFSIRKLPEEPRYLLTYPDRKTVMLDKASRAEICERVGVSVDNWPAALADLIDRGFSIARLGELKK